MRRAYWFVAATAVLVGGFAVAGPVTFTGAGVSTGAPGSFSSIVNTGTLDQQGAASNSTTANGGAVYVDDSLTCKGSATSVITGSIDPAASASVVGVGTLFTTELNVGDRITVTGQTRTVTVITDATHLTVDSAFSDNANDTSVDKLAREFAVVGASGSLDVVVSDQGQLGIGTKTPAAALDVTGAALISSTLTATGGVTSTGTLAATNAATVGTTLGVTGLSTLTGGATQPTTTNAITNFGTFIGRSAAAPWAFTATTGGDAVFNNGTSDAPGLHFYTAANTNMAIDAVGSELRIVSDMDEAGGVVEVRINSAGQISSLAAATTNAFSVATNGARIDFGAGASDYASSDGTTVTFAGPLASASTLAGTTATLTGTSLGFTGTAAGNIITSATAATGGADVGLIIRATALSVAADIALQIQNSASTVLFSQLADGQFSFPAVNVSGSGSGITAGSYSTAGNNTGVYRGNANNTAGLFGVKIQNAQTLTAGADRWALGVYRDNGTSLVASIDTLGYLASSTPHLLFSGYVNGLLTTGIKAGYALPADAFTVTAVSEYVSVASTATAATDVWTISDGTNTCTVTIPCDSAGVGGTQDSGSKRVAAANGAGTGCVYAASALLTLNLTTQGCATAPTVLNVSVEGKWQ